MADFAGYCVKCKEKGKKMLEVEVVEMPKKGGKMGKAAKGKCETCGTSMYRILPSDFKE